MKALYLIFVLVLNITIDCKAQNDTLFISLKDGNIEKIAVSQIQKIKFENVSGIEENKNSQSSANNFPNPFSEGTKIEFEIENPGTIDINIYDNSGSMIQTLTWENCPSGKNQLNWDTRDQNGESVPNGIYYYEIRTNKKSFVKRMIKVK